MMKIRFVARMLRRLIRVSHYRGPAYGILGIIRRSMQSSHTNKEPRRIEAPLLML